MQANYVVSIIVPCYNQAQYLDECLQSVLDQTYQNWECIIVNDGSTDNTEEIAQKWIEKDDRFQYYKKENGGVASARNFGIQKAKGKWILPLDGDDKIAEKYLELASEKFSDKPDLIYCKAEFFGNVNSTFNMHPYNYKELLLDNRIFCSAFFEKGKWEKAGGYDSNLVYGYEDWEFWINILNEESVVIQLDYTGFFYRRKENSRDVAVKNNQHKILHSYSYIYKKHLNKYALFSENPILNFKKSNEIYQEYKNLKRLIYKNPFTRFLFKLMKIS